jgi:hypothetical protein
MSKVRVDTIANLNDDVSIDVVDLLSQADIVDNLTSTDPTKVLSAAKGKALYDLLLANNATIVRYMYNVAQGQTVVSGADTAGKTLTYVPGTVMLVELNGSPIYLGNDYTAATGTSLTLLVGAESVGEMVITTFGSFVVADHFTKNESNALYVPFASVKGFIDGLRLVYTGRTSVTIEAGSAYLPSVGKVVGMSTDKVITGLSPTASTFHHLYYFESGGVGDIEVSTTVPVLTYGTVYQKTGDATRRYIGSLLASSGSQFYSFRHNHLTCTMLYTEGTPGVTPFILLASFNSPTPTETTTQGAVPKQVAVAAIVSVGGSSTGNMKFSLPETISTPGGPNWVDQGSGGSETTIPLSRVLVNQGKYIVWTDSSMSVYCRGYIFER